MKAHTKLRIGAGILAFALGMLGVQLAHGEEGYPNSGDVVNISFVCFPQDAAEKLLSYRGHKNEISDEELQFFQDNCVATPGGQAALTQAGKSGVAFMHPAKGEPFKAYAAEVWGVDGDGDGKSDAWTILFFDAPRPSV
jgi:hypothetical protein